MKDKRIPDEPLKKEPYQLDMDLSLQPGCKKRSNMQNYEVRKFVFSQMLEGKSKRQIIDILKEEHGYESANAHKVYTNCMNEYKPSSDEELVQLKEQYLEMYLDLYDRARKNKEHANAKSIMDSIVKLQGLLVDKQVVKTEHTYKVEF